MSQELDETTAISGSVTLTPSDVLPAILALPLFRRRWLYVVLACLLVAAWWLMALPEVSFGALLPFITFTLGFWAFLFAGPRYFARRNIAALSHPVVRYEVTRETLTTTTKEVTVTRTWSTFRFFKEEADVFLLGIGTGAIDIVAKRAFTPEQLVVLRERLTNEVSTGTQKGIRRVPQVLLLWLLLVLGFLAVWQWLQSGQ